MNEALTMADALLLWGQANLVPGVICLIALNHRIRAVGPLAMAMAGTGASSGLFAAATRNNALVETVAALGAD